MKCILMQMHPPSTVQLSRICILMQMHPPSTVQLSQIQNIYIFEKHHPHTGLDTCAKRAHLVLCIYIYICNRYPCFHDKINTKCTRPILDKMKWVNVHTTRFQHMKIQLWFRIDFSSCGLEKRSVIETVINAPSSTANYTYLIICITASQEISTLCSGSIKLNYLCQLNGQ